MKHCETCTGSDRCTSCKAPYFLLPDKSGCTHEINHCAVDSSDYTSVIDEEGNSWWACPECISGYYADELGQCLSCSDVDKFGENCLEC